MAGVLNVGSDLAGYRLERLLGRGGMGDVYLAVEQELGRRVALKLLSSELARDDQFRRRFLEESRLAASLEHPHVVPVYAAGERDGVLYLAMRYIEGEDLGSLLRREGPLTPDRAVQILEQVADALDAAHARALLHRDVKPANVLLDGDGRAYLADFGLARELGGEERLTQPGQLLGTLAYASPEQIDGRPLDGRTDVYSLGCVAWECLTGQPPFARDSDAAMLFAQLREPPPPLAEVSDALAPLEPALVRALAKEPAARFGSCGELADALAAVVTGARAGHARPRPLPPLPTMVGRTRELAELTTLLSEGTRLLALVGPPGSGRTRLALAVAARAAAMLSCDVVWLSEGSDARPPRLLSAVARGLGLDDHGGPLESAVRVALDDRAAILVVDDADSGGSELQNLLELAPGLRIVATATAQTHSGFEHAQEVSPLPTEEAVELFRERAAGTAADESAVAAVCEQVGRLPLAIELAAARTALLSLETLQDRIADAQRRAAQAASPLAWALELLSPESRGAFARLSVFAGSFAVEAAQNISGLSLDELAALTDAGLLRPASGTGRFELHRALRALGREALDDEHQAVLADRHAAYYAGLVGAAAHAGETRLAALLADEHNVRAALDWSVEQADDERLLELAADVGQLWRLTRAASDLEAVTSLAWLLDDAQRALSEFQSAQAEVVRRRRAALDDERGRLARTVRVRGEERRRDVTGLEAQPYKGLEAFTVEDADRFFGREELVAEIVARLLETRIHALVGASGSGKSSVLHAGVVPALVTTHAPGVATWRVIGLTPGATPLAELAVRLAALAHVPAGALADDLRTDPAHVSLALRQALVEEPAGTRLLLLVDQFEEAFTLCPDETERRAFVEALLHAASGDAPVVAVLAMRADFYSHCAAYPSLAAAVEQSQTLVGRMNEHELRRAIERPAATTGLEVEPGLVDEVLKDLGDEPGSLPLLSHALLETWRRRDGVTLTLGAYRDAGGVEEAIARTAERVYRELSATEQEVARRMFLRLAAVDERQEYMRRRASRDEITSVAVDAEIAERVLGHLVAARLITIGERTVEVAHEALLREWPLLERWLDESRETLMARQRLRAAAEEWASLGRDPGALLRGTRLDAAAELEDDNRTDLDALEREFLAASRAAHADELETARKRNRRLVGLSAALALLLLAAAGSAIFALQQRDRADDKARLATSGSLVRAVDTAVATQRLDQALLLGVAAYRTRPGIDSENALREAVYAARRLIRYLPPVTERAHGVAASSDGTLVALASPRGIVLVTPSGRPRATLGTEDVRRVVTGLDSVVGLTATGTVEAWRPEGSRLGAVPSSLGAVPSSPGGARSIAASPDGRVLAVGTRNGFVRRVQLPGLNETGEPVRISTGPIGSLAFAPDGRTIAAATANGLALLRGDEVQVVPTGLEAIQAVAAGAGRFATSSGTADVTEWAPSGAKLRTLSVSPGERVTALAYGRDGTTLAAGTSSGTVHQWRAARELFAGHAASVTGLAYALTSGAERLLSTAADGSVAVWGAKGSPLYRSLGSGAVASDAGFAPSGRLFVTTGLDNPLSVFDVRTTARLTLPPTPDTGPGGPPAGGRELAFVPGGERVAVVQPDGSAVLWSLQQAAPRLRTSRQPLAVAGAARAAAAGRGVLAVGTADGTVVFPRPANGGQRDALRLGGGIERLAISADGERLAAATEDGGVRLVELGNRRVRRLERIASEPVGGLAFAPDGATLAGAGAEGLTLWDVESGESTLLAGSEGGVSVAFSPDGRFLAEGHRNGRASLWDVDARRRLGPDLGDQAGELTVAWSPTGSPLATTAFDGRTLLWDGALWRDARRLAAYACALAGRDLEAEERRAFLPDSDRRACPT